MKTRNKISQRKERRKRLGKSWVQKAQHIREVALAPSDMSPCCGDSSWSSLEWWLCPHSFTDFQGKVIEHSSTEFNANCQGAGAHLPW